MRAPLNWRDLRTQPSAARMAHEALNAVIALLFGPLAKHRITAVVDARNLGAAALFGKLGFRARPIGGKTCF